MLRLITICIVFIGGMVACAGSAEQGASSPSENMTADKPVSTVSPVPIVRYVPADDPIPTVIIHRMTRVTWKLELDPLLYFIPGNNQRDENYLFQWDTNKDGRTDITTKADEVVLKSFTTVGTTEYTVQIVRQDSGGNEVVGQQIWKITVLSETIPPRSVVIEAIVSNESSPSRSALEIIQNVVYSLPNPERVIWVNHHIDDTLAFSKGERYASWLNYEGLPTVYFDLRYGLYGVLDNQAELYTDALGARLEKESEIDIISTLHQEDSILDIHLYGTTLRGNSATWVFRWALLVPDESAPGAWRVADFLKDETIPNALPKRTYTIEKKLDLQLFPDSLMEHGRMLIWAYQPEYHLLGNAVVVDFSRGM